MSPIKKKIHYLCLEPLRQGHAAYTHVMEIANAIGKQGFEVTLFHPSYSHQPLLPGWAGRLKGVIKTQMRLIRSFSTADIIYIRWHPFSFLTALWCWLSRKAVLQEVNGPYEDFFISWKAARYFRCVFIYMFRQQLRWADHVIVVTPGLKEFIKGEAGHSRVTVIENGVNVDHFTPSHQTDRALPDQFVIFYGTFSKWYDLSVILEATQHKLWPENVKLVVSGDGDKKPIVKEMSQRTEKVLYLGRVPYEDIPGIVSKALACLIPTVNLQGRANTGLSPLKMYESLACGIPVIVSDLPGQADFVREHHCGMIVQDQTPEAWAQRVQEIAFNPKGKDEALSYFREMILKNCSWKVKAKQTADIILSILET